MAKKQEPSIAVPLTLLVVTFGIISYVLFGTPPKTSKLTPLIDTLPTSISLSNNIYEFSTPSASLLTPQSIQIFHQSRAQVYQLFSWIFPHKPKNQLDESRVKAWVSAVAAKINSLSVPPQVVWGAQNGQFAISTGTLGYRVQETETTQALLDLSLNSTTSAMLHATPTGKTLSPDAVIEGSRFIRKLLSARVTISDPTYTRTFSGKELVAFIDLPTDFSAAAIASASTQLNTALYQAPIEPELELTGNTVVRFLAPKDGRRLDTKTFTPQFEQSIRQAADSQNPVVLVPPLIRLPPQKSLSQTNSIGISEMIGRGDSTFFHSIPNRIDNVILTTSKIHAKLILPGEEFSFNKYLGEVSAVTGFKPAYVILQGQTVLGDGGGVCQVSTTLFRALLNAGLPITERQGHAYRVGYYEQNSKPGFDATVYSPHPDLRFTNDTQAPILINAVANRNNLSLYIELWGKSDGRKATITNYKQWGAVPAKPTIYQDDPTLPPGTLKQVDFAAPGLKTSFDYTVTYSNGAVKTKTYETDYAPWAAVYLRGI